MTNSVDSTPIHDFSQCHVGILSKLEQFSGLPELLSAAVQVLVTLYTAHARFEEAEYLPQAYAILSRNNNKMDALALALHLRHAPQVVGYV